MPATGLSHGAPSFTGDPRLAFEAVQMALDEIAPTGGRNRVLKQASVCGLIG
jgi:hypothetical protein